MVIIAKTKKVTNPKDEFRNQTPARLLQSCLPDNVLTENTLKLTLHQP